MRAQFVYENLDFERGVDPKSSLGIGVIKAFEDFIKSYGDATNEDMNNGPVKFLYDGQSVDEFKGNKGQFFKDKIAELFTLGDLIKKGESSAFAGILGSSNIDWEVSKTSVGHIMRMTVTDVGEVDSYWILKSEYPELKKYINKEHRKKRLSTKKFIEHIKDHHKEGILNDWNGEDVKFDILEISTIKESPDILMDRYPPQDNYPDDVYAGIRKSYETRAPNDLWIKTRAYYKPGGSMWKEYNLTKNKPYIDKWIDDEIFAEKYEDPYIKGKNKK